MAERRAAPRSVAVAGSHNMGDERTTTPDLDYWESHIRLVHTQFRFTQSIFHITIFFFLKTLTHYKNSSD